MAGVNKMKQLKRGIAFFLIIMASQLPWSNAQALEAFEKAGVIAEVGYDMMTVFGQNYRIKASTELVSSDPGRKKFSDFKRGDHVWFKGFVLNGVFYVDIIAYQAPEPS
jgi:hypothetical protein